ncbi:hypothetical protein M758_3G215100 [Ceratodon purpureus]|uniref:Uncharacterized protein n=1 Tax=Ceratodon purpureus TaxID=3225 RepID=A0A8T0INC1_CERPU|nr:hypothetical protein KC19_3G214600 [Ceratodon purpureus]KAG0623980.1 hypothetical protein M758_3G215100 [Ceratodon purpureus]
MVSSFLRIELLSLMISANTWAAWRKRFVEFYAYDKLSECSGCLWCRLLYCTPLYCIM